MPTQQLCLLFVAIIFVLFGCGDAARTTDHQTPSRPSWAAKEHPLKRHRGRPCFICPGSSMISPDRFDAEYNGVDAQQHHVGAVRMPEPVVRPCLHSSNKYQQRGKMKTMGTQVVRGPQPGTLLDQGTMHRVVVRVAYQMDNVDNNINDSSTVPPSRHHAYCRYTLQVMPSSESREPVRLCRPPPSPDHGKVACSSVGDDVSITTCRYTCDEGYVTPKSDRHLVHQDWDCYSDPGTSRAPKCIKLEMPVPLDSSQCSRLSLTVPDFDDVHLALPRFLVPTDGHSAVDVTCSDAVQTNNGTGDSSSMLFKRLCLAKNNETDAKFNCHYDVHLTLDPNSGTSVMLAELRFQIGHLSGSSAWCDDRALVERLVETTKAGLVRGNAEACRKANCSLLSIQCVCDHKANSSAGNDVMNVTWTVAASYQPFSYDDYFYEGSEVPEGEMLIEKIKAETEALIQTDLDFRKKIESAGGRLLVQSYQLAKLDLICPLAGYVVNASTNNCQKCPANSFQSKGICQPCPVGTFQEKAGQTECKPCLNRPSVTSSGVSYYNSRCLQQRTSRPVHSSIVALAKLPNRKSSWLATPSAVKTRQLNSKLGNVAAAHTAVFPDKRVTDTANKYNKKKAAPLTQQSSVKYRRHHPHSYQLTKGLQTGHSSVTNGSSSTTIDDEDDPCVPNPCLAGGTCFRSVRYDENNKIVTSFKCSCRLGTKGIHCETPHCPPLYCLNGGTCHVNRLVKGHLGRVDLLNCTCPAGFAGSRCEHKRQNPLNDVKIRHHRHHRHDIDSINTDVTGRFNQTIASKGAGLMGAHCASNPCRNGGRCVDNSHAAPAPGFFTCLCPPNFQGELCDFTPCPAGRGSCSTSYSNHYPSPASRKRHQCWIQTSTGRRQCWPPPSKTHKTP